MNNKLYKLQNKSLPEAVTIVFPETLKSTAGFVVSSALTGITHGQLCSMVVNPTNIIESGEMHTALLIGLFSSVYFAKQIYKNWQQEKKRLTSLANTYEREKLIHIEQKKVEEMMREEEIGAYLDSEGFVEHPELLEDEFGFKTR